MTQDIVTVTMYYMDNVTDSQTETTTMYGTTLDEDALTSTETITPEFSSTESYLNTSDAAQLLDIDSPEILTVFQAFIIIEIIMTALELIISTIAAIKMPRWRRNYRNQMLMQFSLARFIKRVIFFLQFLEEHDKIPINKYLTHTLTYCQFYIDFVIVILVFFFIHHMYNSLIIVLVKISHNSFYKVLTCSWLLPMPISAAWVAVIVTDVMSRWWAYFLICCIFRWPLILVGTIFYVTILYRVMSDKIRKFARSLTVVTFLLCLVINFYLFSKDVIELWCFKSFLTLLVSYTSGLLLNFLILCFYIILVVLNVKNINTHSSRSLPEYSLADVK